MTCPYNVVSPTIRARGPASHSFQGPQKYSVEKDFQKLKAYYLGGFRPLQNILFTTTNSRAYFGVVAT